MGMIACACEHYTINLTPLKVFTVMYIQPFVQWIVCNISVKPENKINGIFLTSYIMHLAIITDLCTQKASIGMYYSGWTYNHLSNGLYAI